MPDQWTDEEIEAIAKRRYPGLIQWVDRLDESIRRECIQIAAKSLTGGTVTDIIDAAGRLYRYIKAGPEPLPRFGVAAADGTIRPSDAA